MTDDEVAHFRLRLSADAVIAALDQQPVVVRTKFHQHVIAGEYAEAWAIIAALMP